MRLSVAFVLAVSVVACSGESIGTGSPSGSSGSSAGSSSGDTSPVPSATDTTKPPPASNDYEKLFGPPETTSLTPDSLIGLWAGSAGSSDVRLKIGASSITIAARCYPQDPASGIDVAARVGAGGIRIVESKTGSGNSSCTIGVKPLTIPQCVTTNDIECYTVKGSMLELVGIGLFTYGYSSHDSHFTKLSD